MCRAVPVRWWPCYRRSMWVLLGLACHLDLVSPPNPSHRSAHGNVPAMPMAPSTQRPPRMHANVARAHATHVGGLPTNASLPGELTVKPEITTQETYPRRGSRGWLAPLPHREHVPNTPVRPEIVAPTQAVNSPTLPCIQTRCAGRTLAPAPCTRVCSTAAAAAARAAAGVRAWSWLMRI